MTLVERVRKIKDVDGTTVCSFEYAEGVDVFHCNGDHIEVTMNKTRVAEKLAEVITQTDMMTNEWGTDIIEEMRENELLENYMRGSGDFESYVTSVIRENYHDYDWINNATEHYDYKRGYTTLTAQLQCQVQELENIKDPYVLNGWTAVVRTASGTTTVEG